MVSWKLHGKILLENNCIIHLEKITSFSLVIFFSFWSFDMNSCWSLASSGQLAWELSSFVNRTIIKGWFFVTTHKSNRTTQTTCKYHKEICIVKQLSQVINLNKICEKFLLSDMFIIMDKRKFLYEISNSKQTNTKGQGWVLQKN